MQNNGDESDEFIEIKFCKKECKGKKKQSLMKYVIMTFDTRPIYRDLTDPLLYSSLHQRALRTGSYIFVFGKQTESNEAHYGTFDVSYT